MYGREGKKEYGRVARNQAERNNKANVLFYKAKWPNSISYKTRIKTRGFIIQIELNLDNKLDNWRVHKERVVYQARQGVLDYCWGKFGTPSWNQQKDIDWGMCAGMLTDESNTEIGWYRVWSVALGK